MAKYEHDYNHGRDKSRRYEEVPPYIRQDVPLRSDQAMKIHKKLTGSFLNGQGVFDYWRLSKVESLENESFEIEYSQIRNDFLAKGFKPNEVTSNWGFLATTSEKMIDVSLRDGLCVKFSPINTIGYCIAGVHLSIHADVCLQEAALELGGDVKDMILVAFKFMYGQRKQVPPSTSPEVYLLPPSPGFNSHISDVPARTGEGLSLQHTHSFVYLYEFENEFYHPRQRPRHCCPTAALHFKRVKPIPPQIFQAAAAPQSIHKPPASGPPIPGISAAVQSAVNLVTSDPALRKVLESVSASVGSRPTMTTTDIRSDAVVSFVRDCFDNDKRRRGRYESDKNPDAPVSGLLHASNQAHEPPSLLKSPVDLGKQDYLLSSAKQSNDTWQTPQQADQSYQGRPKYMQRGYGRPYQQHQQQFQYGQPTTHAEYSQSQQQASLLPKPDERNPQSRSLARPQQQGQRQFQQKEQFRKNPYVKPPNQPWRRDTQQQQQGDSRTVNLKDHKQWSDQPPPVLRSGQQGEDYDYKEQPTGSEDNAGTFSRKRPLLNDNFPSRGSKQPRRMMNPYVQRTAAKPQDTFKKPGAPASFGARGRNRGRGGFRGKPL